MNIQKVSNFRPFINSIGGRFITVDYLKKDGTPRTITGIRANNMSILVSDTNKG